MRKSPTLTMSMGRENLGFQGMVKEARLGELAGHREMLLYCRVPAGECVSHKVIMTRLSIPRGPMFWCDNRCSDKDLRFWQFASVVVDDVEESYTVNLCQQCYNGRLTAQGLAPLKSC